jgi:hypothetical protein
MNNEAAHRLANLILADFNFIAPELSANQLQKMQTVIVGWATQNLGVKDGEVVLK